MARSWSYRVSNGFVTFTYSNGTYSAPAWRFQIYWPEVVIKKVELRLRFPTGFRIMWDPTIKGFGFNLIGFGFGLEWHR